MTTRRHFLLGLGAFTLAGLLGCGEDKPKIAFAPVPLKPEDECAVCGMNVLGFPGPKAEAWLEGAARPLTFCSTRDFFAYVLQPEAGAVLRALYVHDVGGTGWDAPADSAFVDARSAWYVTGHALRGAMGPTLASFADRAKAEAFATEHGGRVLAFGEVDLKIVTGLG